MLFEINVKENSLGERLKERKFSELGFREREHLQEWIAKTPEALGEDLLIIQKEFAGFEGTRERLDLLALDTDANLVIIENKLDDAGRAVTWQALKYGAYCSTLKESDIIEIYQKYLDTQGQGQDAIENIRDFLGQEDIGQAELNSGLSQRFILVANHFPKEITTTAIWLINRGFGIKCVKVTPFKIDGTDKLLLQSSQIIPVPEAEDYMISMASKNIEERAKSERSRVYLRFWDKALKYFHERDAKTFQKNESRSWQGLLCSMQVSGCHYVLELLKNQVRVGVFIGSHDKSKNDRIYEYLHDRRSQIENDMGHELEWENLEGNKRCTIKRKLSIDTTDEENWQEIVAWMYEHAEKFHMVFNPYVPKIEALVKAERDKADS